MREKRRRVYTHKGKTRFKKRLPRKVKKIYKATMKQQQKDFIEYWEKKNRPIHGDDWMDYIIYGG